MFKTERLQVSFLDEQRGVWDFAGKMCKGTKFHYEVDDGNYPTRNRWQFVVQVPDDWTKGNYINVRPVEVPSRKVWAGLDRRTVSFQRATLGRHRAKVYAKLAIADVEGEKTRRVLSHETRKLMPKWLAEFRPVQKQRVTNTAANDGEHLVAVVDRDDHARMIALFMALKAWVLYPG